MLDPETTIFKPVELQVDLGIRPLYAIIGCRLLEVVRFDERHTLFVDEEGLQDGLTAFTIFEGFPQPIAGKIVLVGGDGSTPYTSPLISLEDAAKANAAARSWTRFLQRQTRFHRAVSSSPVRLRACNAASSAAPLPLSRERHDENRGPRKQHPRHRRRNLRRNHFGGGHRAAV
nr:DUF3846 domain-containing protein [Sinorhizobium fredii]